MEDKLIKRLMTSLKCDSCGQHYEVYNIDILGHREDMWFLKVFCPSCHTRCLVAAVVKESRAPAVVSDHQLYSIALSPNYEQDETILIGSTDGWGYWSNDNGT